eukprot:330776-Pleurochrysis_carterae.AAC.3
MAEFASLGAEFKRLLQSIGNFVLSKCVQLKASKTLNDKELQGEPRRKLNKRGTGKCNLLAAVFRIRRMFAGDTSTVHRYGRGVTSHCASVLCVLRGFVSERQNELTKQHTKQTAVDDTQAEKEPNELSSLHTKQDVN